MNVNWFSILKSRYSIILLSVWLLLGAIPITFATPLEKITDINVEEQVQEQKLEQEPEIEMFKSDPIYYYVSAEEGDDDNDGLSVTPGGNNSGPFKTIQKAADVAVAGDTVFIRGGVYEEEVIPKNSGTANNRIVFEPYNKEKVTISGADWIDDADWKLYKDNIYEVDIELPVENYSNTGIFANQIFVNGEMMTEARYPNNTGTLMKPTLALAEAGSTSTANVGGTVKDSKLPSGDLKGAIFYHLSYGKWVSQTGEVTSNKEGEFDFVKAAYDNGNVGVIPPNWGSNYFTHYYLTGKMLFLDTAKEWFYNGEVENKLYLWAPDGESPSKVQVKMRNNAFDLSDRQYITIKNVNILASTIATNANSSNNVIDGIDAKYISHFVTQPSDPSLSYGGIYISHSGDTGIILNGENNEIRNSKIAYSAGNGIALVGKGGKAINNYIHDVNYTGTYTAGISADNDNIIISRNTIFNTARDGIRFGDDVIGSHFNNSEISYNDISNYGMTNEDLAGLYVCCDVDGSGTEVKYNYIHDDQTQYFGYGNGIYIDNGSNNFKLHHNVLYNIQSEAIFLNRTHRGGIPIVAHNEVYNNTMLSRFKVHNLDSNIVRNNIMVDKPFIVDGSTQSNNLLVGTAIMTRTNGVGLPLTNGTTKIDRLLDVGFINSESNDFRLREDSIAQGLGIPIPGITDATTEDGKTYVGAYGVGDDWIPGYQIPVEQEVTTLDTPILIDLRNDRQGLHANWSPVPGATGYKVHIGTATGQYDAVIDVGIATGKTIFKLMDEELYFVAISAYSDRLESEISNEKSMNYNSLNKVVFKNPGFEDGGTDWYHFDAEVSSEARSGNNSAKINNTNRSIEYKWLSGFVPGEEYEVSAYFKIENRDPTVKLQFGVKEHGFEEHSEFINHDSEEYEKYTLKFKAGSSSAKIYVWSNGMKGEVVYVDDFEIKQVSSSNPKQPATHTIQLSNEGWSNTDVVLTIVDDAVLGRYKLQYKFGESDEWINYNEPVTVVDEGETKVYARKIDALNANYISEIVESEIKIHKGKPTVPVITYEEKVGDKLVVTIVGGTDDVVGIERTEYRIGESDEWKTYITPFELKKEGNITIYARTVNKADSFSEEVSKQIHSTSGGGGTVVYPPYVPTQDGADTGKPEKEDNKDKSGEAGEEGITEEEEESTKETEPSTEQPVNKLIDIKGHWAQAAIEQLVNKQLMTGYPDGTFKPKKSLTRTEVATLIVRLLGLETENSAAEESTTFTDVPKANWAYDSVQIAAEHGIIQGRTATMYAPNDEVTRQELALMISRALQLPAGEIATKFKDSDEIAPWAKDAVERVYEAGLIKGYDDQTFRPTQAITRAEAAVTLARWLER
ncbi:S-layer homology domain-containing protein [Paenibacillus yanchengensis]|uniref:S-layer homology domain-containing protein n=1 Tax=Paenibacillus yanchengensis TaxID=2035833 RepID=A0ABW4YJ72_9BACL